jgi:hypothetical protein
MFHEDSFTRRFDRHFRSDPQIARFASIDDPIPKPLRLRRQKKRHPQFRAKPLPSDRPNQQSATARSSRG